LTKKVIIIGLFILFVVIIFGLTTILASASWTSQVTTTHSIYVNITPIITWSNPANITYGTALTSTQLDTTSSVPGTFAYNPPSGTVLSEGTHVLTATFTPTDTTATDSVLINVIQATPAITWSNPANITYGTALSNVQLNASASVAGNCSYTPSNGTILSTGTQQTLNTIFTPTDSANYTTASLNVKINVMDHTQEIVLTPTRKINQMVTFVQGLATSGELNEGSSIELTAILQAAEKNIDKNPFAEPGELKSFIIDVKDKIDRGVLSPTNGQALIDSANDVINSLNNQVRR
jgi:hypothetical protein